MEPYIQDALNICEIAVAPRVCKGFLNLREIFVSNLIDFDLKPDYFCEEIVKTCDTNLYVEKPVDDYIKRVLADKPESIKDDDFINKKYKEMSKSKIPRKTFKMAHITDAHFDFKYAKGSNWDCAESNIICCRKEQGFPLDVSK